jgi:hypothetical protein
MHLLLDRRLLRFPIESLWAATVHGQVISEDGAVKKFRMVKKLIY